jgi:hypothetical protein
MEPERPTSPVMPVLTAEDRALCRVEGAPADVPTPAVCNAGAAGETDYVRDPLSAAVTWKHQRRHAMLCAHSIRRLKPGTFDQFTAGFGPPDEVGYAEQKAASAPLVDELLSNGMYEIVVSKAVDGAAA